MKVKKVDNKSAPITTAHKISTSTSNTKSSSKPNNDSAIKIYQTFVRKFGTRK